MIIMITAISRVDRSTDMFFLNVPGDFSGWSDYKFACYLESFSGIDPYKVSSFDWKEIGEPK